jgi:nicotinamide-nucleotide amidase
MASLQVLTCGKALAEKEWTISFVEGVTAGKMCYEFSTVPNSEKILVGGLVCYDPSMEEDILEIPNWLIESFTPESPEVTKAMATSFYKSSQADVCVAVNGIISPTGETPEKPLGSIFIHIVLPNKDISKQFEFKGNPQEIVNQAIDATALLISSEINKGILV